MTLVNSAPYDASMGVRVLADDRAALESPAAMRTRMTERGVVHLPSLLDRSRVREVAAAVSDVLVEHGWVRDTTTLEATDQVRVPGQPGFAPVYAALQSIEALHRLVFEPRLFEVVGLLFDEPVFVHPGKVVRVTPRDPEGVRRTRPHQDFSLLQTTPDTVTAWIPLVECPTERGGLALLPGSHRQGFRRPTGKLVDGEYDIFLDGADEESGWESADFQPGDVVLVHGLTVHAALPNRSGSCRISMDSRFQSVADPLVAATLNPNRAAEMPPWEDLTAAWETREWIEVPESVRVHRHPAGTTLEDVLDALVVPPSRFVPS